MIYQLDIKEPKQTPVSWLANVVAFREPRTFEFTPGLNILWSRNGGGKTTLLTLLARLFHCEQGSCPVVTQASLSALVGDRIGDVPIEGCIDVAHDGQAVRHFDPGRAVGLIGGGAGFDWDFGIEGISNQMFRGSAGQTNMFRFDRILNETVAGIVPEIEWKLDRASVRRQRIDAAARILKKNRKKGPATILLDEPERSYDLNAQASMWRFLRAYADEVQFIVASHSLFALNIPEAHYFDLTPNYLAESLTALGFLKKWSEDKPKKFSEAVAKKAREELLKRRR